MDFASGAMDSLLHKLGELLLEEYSLQSSVKTEIGELKAELKAMQAALQKVSNVPFDQLDPQVQIWANEVRELSYAIEDSLDSSMVRIEGLEPAKPKLKHLLSMARNEFTKFKARHEIANDIKAIESQVRKVNERYNRYKFDDVVANPPTTTVDPRLSALYSKVSDLVGIDKPVAELTKVLSESADIPGENPKIVSIVGFGGLGKTTLAKALYDKFTCQCRGFVPVGRNPDTKKVLRDILLELDEELYKAAATMDEIQLIKQLKKFLAGKRYFIVIDDIWDIPTWETIKCAFVDSHPESRIIITTRDVDVAKNAGGIYAMKTLSDYDSKTLFYTRTRGGEVTPDNQPAEVTNKILKKCGGVPLAVITIASLLAGKPSEDWSRVYEAIGFGHEDSNDVVQNTRKILSFSYYDLPFDQRRCLLYLGMFPEDHFIEKKSLIWRWVSEGFIPDIKGMGSYELGEMYFIKLVNKSMIRWIEPNEFLGGPGGCRVHDMVLDLIRTISNDVNFVTVHDMGQHGTCSRGKGTRRVRRLALHGASAKHNCSIETEHVRSFSAITCGDTSKVPLLMDFKVLRVLVIEGCVFSEGHSSLEHLSKLVHLRYLGMVESKVNELPEGIGHDLKFLEILDVRGGYISELPRSVGELKKLRCLWADRGTRMNGEIGKLTCLEELQLHSVDKCPNFFTDVRKLTKLRELEIFFDEMEATAGKALAESLCNLQKIQSLFILKAVVDKQNYIDIAVHSYKTNFTVRGGSLESMEPSTKLCVFTLPNIVIPRMPRWISSSRARLLSHLWLSVEVAQAQDFQTLGRLPSLLLLVFIGKKQSGCMSYTFGSDEFHKLRRLCTTIEIAIEEGALPMLDHLEYGASARREDTLVPWNNSSCPLLDSAVCRLDCANSGNEEVEAAEVALRDASTTHPGRPLFRIEKENYDREAGGAIDQLERILVCLDRPDEADHPADEEAIRETVNFLEYMLRHPAKPRVKRYVRRLRRYGEQELRGIVAKLRSWLHDHASTNQEGEEQDNSDSIEGFTDTDDGEDDDKGDDGHDDTDQEQADKCVATSSGGHQERGRANVQSNCFSSFIHAIKTCLMGS